MSRQLGELIRERRLGLGLSLGQLAAKLSTTPAVVRIWERGDELPDAASQATLVDLLDLDAASVARLAEEKVGAAPEEPAGTGLPTDVVPSAADPAMTTAAGAAEIAEAQPAEAQLDFAADASLEVDATGDEDLRKLFAPPEPPPMLEPPSIPEPVSVPEPLPTPEEPLLAEPSPLDEAQPAVEVPQVAVLPGPPIAAEPDPPIDPDAPRVVPLRYPQSAPPGVPVEIAETQPNPWNPLRYIYDPDKPWIYWIRAGLTVVVLAVLLNILFDSVGELFDKIGEVIDSIESTEVVEGGDADA